METLLTHRGWAVDNLGAATPATSLRTAVRVVRPTAVVVVAHVPGARLPTVAALAGVAALGTGTPLFYAGGAFAAPEQRDSVYGTYLGTELVAAADHVAASRAAG